MNGGELRIRADVEAIDDGWSVRLSCPGQSEWSWPAAGRAPHAMRAGDHNGRRVPLPDEGWCQDSDDHEHDKTIVPGAVAAFERGPAHLRPGGDHLGWTA